MTGESKFRGVIGDYDTGIGGLGDPLDKVTTGHCILG